MSEGSAGSAHVRRGFNARSRLRLARRRLLMLAMALTARVELAAASQDPSSLERMGDISSRVSAPAQSGSSQTSVDGFFKLENTQYMTQIPGNSQLNQEASLIGNFQVHRTQGLRAALDITAANNINFEQSHFALSEAYLGLGWQNDQGQVYVGRKLEQWSLLDSDWQLGLWQPTFGELDALKPLNQGLAGIFWKQQAGEHALMAFVTPMFIPSMGPNIQEKNGSLVSDSRWYRQPSPTFAYQGVVTRVVYSLDIPDAAKLISNPGAGLRYSVGEKSLGTWFSANYGYKPINALLLKYKTVLKTPEIDPRGEVSVSPGVGYHTLGGADLGYRFAKGMVAVSYLADHPEIQYPEDRWVQQQPAPMQALGVHTHFEAELPYLSQDVGVSLNYLKISDGKIRDVDSEKGDEGALFESRFNFTNAAMVKLDFHSTLWRRPATATFKYMREFAQRGMLIGTEFNIFPSDSWVVTAGADVLGVDNEKSNVDGTFLNQFRANDRYYGGLSYVF